MRWLAGTGLLLAAPFAQAYVGPGLGVGVIGTIVGILASVVLAVVGTIWYPVKRILRTRSNQRSGAGAEGAEPDAESTAQARAQHDRHDRK